MRDPRFLLRQLALHARAAVLSFAAVLAVAIGVPMLAHADPTALTVSTLGGLLASSPGAGVAATNRICERRSGTMIPLTSPPRHGDLALGFFDQPISTLIPGPSAPVAQSTIRT